MRFQAWRSSRALLDDTLTPVPSLPFGEREFRFKVLLTLPLRGRVSGGSHFRVLLDDTLTPVPSPIEGEGNPSFGASVEIESGKTGRKKGRRRRPFFLPKSGLLERGVQAAFLAVFGVLTTEGILAALKPSSTSVATSSRAWAWMSSASWATATSFSPSSTATSV